MDKSPLAKEPVITEPLKPAPLQLQQMITGRVQFDEGIERPALRDILVAVEQATLLSLGKPPFGRTAGVEALDP